MVPFVDTGDKRSLVHMRTNLIRFMRTNVTRLMWLAALCSAMTVCWQATRWLTSAVPSVVVTFRLLTGYAVVQQVLIIIGGSVLLAVLGCVVFLLMAAPVLLFVVVSDQAVGESGELAGVVLNRVERASRQALMIVSKRFAVAPGQLSKIVLTLIIVIVGGAVMAGVVNACVWWTSHISTIENMLPEPRSVWSEITSYWPTVKAYVIGPAKVAGWVWLGLAGSRLVFFALLGLYMLWRKIPA